MTFRLHSLIVAGGLVWAGAACALWSSTAEPEPSKLVQTQVMGESEDSVQIQLQIPGFSAEPKLQVLSKPCRIVVDLPGVEKDAALPKLTPTVIQRDFIKKVRIAQFSAAPNPVTRLVFEVTEGTQAQIRRSSEGLTLEFLQAQGKVQARFESDGALPGNQTADAAPPPASPLPAVGAPYRGLPLLSAAALSPTLPQEITVKGAHSSKPEPDAAAPVPEGRSGKVLGEYRVRYTGQPMTVDLQSTDLAVFLRILAEAGKLNLVVDPEVNAMGAYTFKFVDTPWDQILDIILKNAGLGKEIQNNVLRVAKVEKLQKEEEDRKRLEETKALAGPLQSVTRPLSYAKVLQVKPIIEKVLTKRGNIIIDERTNVLILQDLPQNIPVLDDLLAILDVQVQQVQIEARVVEANKNFEKKLGVQWLKNTPATVNGTATSLPWIGQNSPSSNSYNDFNRPGSNQTLGVGFIGGAQGVTDVSGAAGELWISFLSNRFSINAILQGLEKDGTVKIISSPKITTQNNRKATILAGQKIPYPAMQAGGSGGGAGAITVQFADANLQLDVTPQITNEGTIIMDIKMEKAEADFSRTVNSTPTILRKMVETQVLVRDGGTAVLGGVHINKTDTGNTGVPFLRKLPILGALFSSKSNSEDASELLVFITPRIIKN